ncbi:MAG: HNH endonuclease [Oligoflexus sp.]|nr:HNH endonuclease [Oligoflexus sp.]
MQRVLVLDKLKSPLMPCHPARARELLRKQKAKVFRLKPFTIILIERTGGDVQPLELKVDPGSKVTGIAIVGEFRRGQRAIFAVNLEHRGPQIKAALEARRSLRRSRRSRKTRYRAPRFLNRTRQKGWLPPSIKSRADNVRTWTKKLTSHSPISSIAVETVRFDLQKIVNPEISGIQYQQGELLGYEVREYLLEKWGRKCAYCDAKGTPLEVEHIVPKSKRGSDRVSNLTLACNPCNQKKGSSDIEVFVKDQKRLAHIKRFSLAALRDAAAVNATRYATGDALKSFGLPTSFWSGGRTKKNRISQDYPKDHWIDACCVGVTGERVFIPIDLKPLLVKAESRGSRQKCLPDKYGFPRTAPKANKRVHGFQTGDLVEANVLKGKKSGRYKGRVAVRSTGNFNIKTDKLTVQGISYKSCRIVQRVDGYSYAMA